MIKPDFSRVFVAHSCLGLQTTSPRLFPPVSKKDWFHYVVITHGHHHHHNDMSSWKWWSTWRLELWIRQTVIKLAEYWRLKKLNTSYRYLKNYHGDYDGFEWWFWCLWWKWCYYLYCGRCCLFCILRMMMN